MLFEENTVKPNLVASSLISSDNLRSLFVAGQPLIKRILSYSLQSLRQSLTASFFSMIIERATAKNDLTVPSVTKIHKKTQVKTDHAHLMDN